ncbi:hypothetical protein DACRYDRAFT_113120 [Dacryopinax primogenitus]|uniref:Uncharacterized protein n=1 Tax=Dacryopinax primogenitus (strain DJM 731) TaxID=1858805 RepID=M5GH07_DACPD|nr:uncharacterized protein DACRYDRAFT_113120 [Dacryopinax primogenitus]EJU06408.1 hypothetical protein DACRYDRAFT_113120 [Dacryopinax primogenitus]
MSPNWTSTNTEGGDEPIDVLLADLLRSLQANREAQEADAKRRLEWEAAVEARYKARIAEMDIRFASLQQQVDALKRALGAEGLSGATTGDVPTSSAGPLLARQRAPMSPLSTAALGLRPLQPMPPDAIQPHTLFNPGGHTMGVLASVLGKRPHPTSEIDPNPPAPAQTFWTSLDNVTAELTRYQMEAWQQMKARRKRDSRPSTIQTATRVHLLRVMGLSSDKVLPPSHVEGEPNRPGEPIRWVWDKTQKQSAHNAKMKERFITDLQRSRALYPLVREEDFAFATLERAFDQAFITLRRKARSQAGLTPETEEQRLEKKSKRARRANRKKTKLGHRVAARGLVPAFRDKAFDRAMELGMMSSESSDSEEEDADGVQEESMEGEEAEKERTFRVRGLPWRSQRLKAFYAALDEADCKDHRNRPRRGSGRKERKQGKDKEGAEGKVPPGVGGWMVSKRWGRDEQEEEEELDWSKLCELGEESDNEEGEQ